MHNTPFRVPLGDFVLLIDLEPDRPATELSGRGGLTEVAFVSSTALPYAVRLRRRQAKAKKLTAPTVKSATVEGSGTTWFVICPELPVRVV